jgi:cytochrome b6-f complex iron-sulfur subunit
MIPLLRTLCGTIVGGLFSLIASVAARAHGSGTIEGRKIARRGFIRNAALGSVVIILTQLGAGFVRFFWPNKTGAFGKPIPVGAASIPPVEGTPLAVTQGKFYLVNTQAGLMALYWTCPHLGCTVPWVQSENQFHCPCHGSIYNYVGERTGGPAPRPMDYMPVTVEPNGDVTVDTGEIKTRSAFDPSQAVPYSA